MGKVRAIREQQKKKDKEKKKKLAKGGMKGYHGKK
jgi:hypothetical protein